MNDATTHYVIWSIGQISKIASDLASYEKDSRAYALANVKKKKSGTVVIVFRRLSDNMHLTTVVAADANLRFHFGKSSQYREISELDIMDIAGIDEGRRCIKIIRELISLV